MQALPIIGSIAGNLLSGAMSAKAGRESEEIAQENAENIRAETAESRRRLAIEQEQSLGRSRAAAGATGLRMSGTQENYISQLAQNYQKELDWLTKSGASRAAVEEARGRVAKQEGYGTALSKLAGAFGSAGKWFQ